MLFRTRKILIACMPKSASTFLKSLLTNLPGFEEGFFSDASYDRKEQDLSPIAIRKFHRRFLPGRICVAQHHVKYSRFTEKRMRKYDIFPVVLVRNIFDCMASLRDHIRNESPISPMAYFTEYHAELPNDELDEAIARLVVPWYIHFYMSWRNADRDFLWVDYEDVRRNPIEVAGRILERAHVTHISDSDFEKALERVRGKKEKIRFNKGMPGRGHDLSPAVKGIVLDMLKFYPETHDDAFIKRMLDYAKEEC